jgi:hypothetical protein
VMSPSSEQTAEALTTVNVGVVLVDLLHSDEWDYVSRIRDATRAQDVPLIVLTGWLWADGYSRRKARELQCAAILQKPCPLELLVDTLKRAAEYDAPT